MHQTKLPFRNGVPRWMHLAIAIFIMIPVTIVNGAYTGSTADISGELGIIGEDISIAFFGSAAGMSIGFPIAKRLRAIINTKTILLCGLIIQTVLSFICGATPYIWVIVVVGFVIGILRAITLMEVIVIMMPFFSPTEKRSEFYPYFYPLSIGFAQLALLLTAYCAYYYQWQYMYNIMQALLLVSIVLVLIYFRYGKRPIRFPFKDIDWWSVLFGAGGYLCFIYFTTYGKVEDWYDSANIIAATILAVIFIVLFVRRQLTSGDNPFIRLDIYKKRNVWVSHILMFLMIFFSSGSTLISSYATSILRVDNIRANDLCWFMFPAFALCGGFTWWWYKWKLPVRWLFFIGFGANMLCFMLFYFQIHPAGLYESLFLPTFLRGIGLGMLFICTATYSMEGLAPTQFNSNAFFFLGIRSAIGPSICSAIFANWIYRSIEHNSMILSKEIDMLNPLAVSQYTASLNNALAQGMSITNAQTIATTGLYNTVQAQSTLLTLKNISGILVIIAAVVMIVMMFFPFYRSGRRLRQTGGGGDLV